MIPTGRIIDQSGKSSLYYDENENLIFPLNKHSFTPYIYLP